MKWCHIKGAVFSAFILSAGIAQAQTSIDINKAKLTWQWTQGTGGLASEYHVKCGGASNSYSKITIISGILNTTANIKDVITGSGNWYCTVSAANQFGESGNSNEVFFSAGATPSSPTNLTIQAQ